MEATKKRIAVYAGSFDPVTNGHMDIITRAAALYDELIVMVAVDSEKTYTFSSEERTELAEAAVRHLGNVRVVACVDRYVAKVAEELGATVIVRGLRNFMDLEVEKGIVEENRKIRPDIETVFLTCRPELAHVSSSMVKKHRGADPGWVKEVARSVPAAVAAALKEDWILKKAKTYWQKLVQALGNPAESSGVFERLVAWYAEPHRGYHTLEHIVKMLDELERCGITPRNYCALALAIWFHDAAYDPKAKDNEEVSTRMANVNIVFHMGLPQALSVEVTALIMATKHNPSAPPPSDPDTQLLVDLDLMIFGAPEDEFDEYEVGIRKEYAHVSAREFAIGRSGILQGFLDRHDPIMGSYLYATEALRAKYEEKACANLARSISNLKSGIVVLEH